MKLVLCVALIVTTAAFFVACDSTTVGGANPPSSGDVAATVNSKPISNQEVEKVIKQQLQGQELKLSPLELAQARLQALDNLIQQEVMYQKADKEKTLPSDEEVTQALNEQKQQSGMTADDYNKKLQEIGETDASLREKFKKQLAFKKLIDKLSSAVEPPKDAEVESIFKSNPDYFVKKRGATFKAIVLDPNSSGETDATKTSQDVQLKINEINNKLKQGATFEALAAEYSEDPNTKLRSGDWRDISEAEMKQLFGESFATYVMSDNAPIGSLVPQPIPFEGRTLLLKIAAKQEKDENLTLETPDVKIGITTALTNQRKQLLTAAYQARAMDEARIENYLAKKVIENPNELGSRPADANVVAATAAESPSASASPLASAAASPAKK